MKTKLLLVLILLAQTFYAQDLTGSWRGEIDLGAMKLPLLLDIKKENNAYVSTARSPKQGDKIITVDKTEFRNDELIFEMNELKASYKGLYKTDHFEGTFEQNSRSFPLNLYRNDGTVKSSPQDQKIKDIGNREINTKKIDDFLNYLTAQTVCWKYFDFQKWERNLSKKFRTRPITKCQMESRYTVSGWIYQQIVYSRNADATGRKRKTEHQRQAFQILS